NGDVSSLDGQREPRRATHVIAGWQEGNVGWAIRRGGEAQIAEAEGRRLGQLLHRARTCPRHFDARQIAPNQVRRQKTDPASGQDRREVALDKLVALPGDAPE